MAKKRTLLPTDGPGLEKWPEELRGGHAVKCYREMMARDPDFAETVRALDDYARSAEVVVARQYMGKKRDENRAMYESWSRVARDDDGVRYPLGRGLAKRIMDQEVEALHLLKWLELGWLDDANRLTPAGAEVA